MSISKFGYAIKNYGLKKCLKKFKTVTHCIFDLDGTILDNQHKVDEAYAKVFRKHGKTYSLDWRLKVMGRTGKSTWQTVAKELKLKIGWKSLYQQYRESAKDTLTLAPLRPGVEKLINHLYKHKIPMAIATSSKKTSFTAKTKHIKHLISKFHHVLSGGDDYRVTESKPSGQIFSVCASFFEANPHPRFCLVFEDSPVGVLAAKNACMQVVGVPCKPTPWTALQQATEVVDSLEDFFPERYGLPPYSK
nr:pseudouridine-5'-phosphatase-like [Onthophagus taurus]